MACLLYGLTTGNVACFQRAAENLKGPFFLPKVGVDQGIRNLQLWMSSWTVLDIVSHEVDENLPVAL
ncbi:hypothetical protein N7540_001655 [Penicillium herquei]|nr:hypothetical protein N7540_001655 [Penicillium herquei]